MSSVALRMPPEVESTTPLATQVVDSFVPAWARTPSGVTLKEYGDPDYFKGQRSEADVYRLPNSSQVLRDWLYTRPDVEAVDEEAFANCAVESSSIFRIEGFGQNDSTILVSPSISNHWLLIPVQSINGVTVGLVYLDVLFQRQMADKCVPPLRVGKFAIQDSTGEVFVTGWTENFMVVGWTQSIIKCERVRELLMYHAPKTNGVRPRNLLLRNSFYERRDCHLCGQGTSLDTLKPPCCGISTNILSDPYKQPLSTSRMRLTDVSTLYRRFRGGYYGVCSKAAYCNGVMLSRDLVSVFIDVKHGLHSVKQRFRRNLERNCDFSLDCLFGLSPRSSSRLMFLKTSAPLASVYQLAKLSDGSGKRKMSRDRWDRGAVANRSMNISPISLDPDTSGVSSERSTSPARTRRRVGVDEVDRNSIEFERKIRNRIAANKSNLCRKEKLAKEREELRMLKEKRDVLLAKKNELSVENFALQLQVQSETLLEENYPL